jgi:hypothetical protein
VSGVVNLLLVVLIKYYAMSRAKLPSVTKKTPLFGFEI